MNIIENKDLLKNRYCIVKKIGFGASGTVSGAIDTFTNRRVAIKKVPRTLPEQIKRLKRECFFLQNISHPNLVKAYDFFIEEEDAYMVIEYVYGKPLSDVIYRNKYGMSLVGQLAIANQTARGIQVLNMGGIMHRDIKPQNIMLNVKTGEIKVLDLGIAKNLNKELSSLTIRGSLLGTCAYMSPEQTHGEVSDRTDVFSLGVVLHQFFTWTDNSPFATNNIHATIMKIREHDPVDICSVLNFENVSPRQRDAYEKISAIISKALHKKPEDRWANVGILADSFKEIQQKLLSDMTDKPEKYKIVTSRQISPDLKAKLLAMREEYPSNK